jgi:MinD-like ATPase involved in chromosome partitioning or flagellar assembly
MTHGHFVVAGLAHARAPWFSRLASWATGGVVPVEFVKCVSLTELRARLEGTRAHSAVMVDSGMPGLDRDLLAQVTRTGAAAIVVAPPPTAHRWRAMGAAATADADFTPDDLVALLRDHAPPATHPREAPPTEGRVLEAQPTGRLVAVTGAGGTGTSVIAAALASGLAGQTSSAVLLADLALRADQAMIHDSREVIPGVQELVEAHRTGTPPPDELMRLTFAVPGRGYHLLLGLRRARDWTAIRPRALHAALGGLLGCFDTVVADISPDVEGERETGSADVEERHLLARASLERAAITVVVGTPTMKGTYSLARLVGDLADTGVDPARIVAVINHAPRNPRSRAEATAALAALTTAVPGATDLRAPIFVPSVKHLDRALRDAVALPHHLVRPVTAAVTRQLNRVDRVANPSRGTDEPEPVIPGALGAWAVSDDDGEAVA